MNNPFCTLTDVPFIPPMPLGHPDNPLTYTGRCTYALYYQYQRCFTSWLVHAAASLGVDVWGRANKKTGQIVIPFHELPCLATAVACHGTVPQRMLYYLNYMLRLRGEWDVRNEKKPTQINCLDYELHSKAMANLRSVGDAFQSATITQEEPEDLKLTHVLPRLPGEAFFAWVCFFNDLFAIRAYLRYIWHNYQQSLETLTTATLVTNIAIRMIRENCDHLIVMTWRLPGMPAESKITEWIYQGITGDFDLPGRFCNDSWQNYEAIVQEEGSEKYDPAFLPCYDEITNGWLTWGPYLSFEHIPLWLVISFQILVDVREVLGPYSPTALDDLEEYAYDMDILFRKNMERANAKERIENDPDYADACCRFIGNVQKYIKKDNDAGKEINLFRAVPDVEIRGHQGKQSNSFLLKTNVWLCGMQCWNMERTSVQIVHLTVKLHECIMPAALLYLAMRKLGFIDIWYDMEIVLQTRGPEIFSYAENCWAPCYYPDDATLFNSLKYTDKPPGLRKFYLGDRYVSDLFSNYGWHSTYKPQSGVPTNTICEVVDRIYHREDWKFWMKHDVCSMYPPNVLVSLYVVTSACHLDEELASFDWHSMHDTCQKFFDNLRQTLLDSFFSEFGRISRSPPPSAVGPSDLDDSDTGDSASDVFDSNVPTPGSVTPPSSIHTLGMASYDSVSLDALYYLIFADDPERHQENMILAALCLNVSEISHCKIPNREYMIEKWADGIKEHAEELGISLLLARDVLLQLISKEEEVPMSDGDVHMSNAAVRLWKRHRLRTETLEGASAAQKNFRNKTWLHRGPPLHRNATEARKPQTWDRYEEWYREHNAEWNREQYDNYQQNKPINTDSDEKPDQGGVTC
ncbi:hypothetical protein FHL15_011036 [Xylaria flabelliformis]|uniref:DUF6604 domain-containing protein n=1 Tax=Xylaria flabelliformis TaxID=2512241 RepID=A0A553HJF4_9PEZI|nr:hypothetical protein FHL15_011036 [Xylaria flabelliformis]